MALLIERLVSLCNDVLVLFVGCEVDNLISNLGILGILLVNDPERSLDKSVLVDPCVGCE